MLLTLVGGVPCTGLHVSSCNWLEVPTEQKALQPVGILSKLYMASNKSISFVAWAFSQAVNLF